jgi:hypothetical protein
LNRTAAIFVMTIVTIGGVGSHFLSVGLLNASLVAKRIFWEPMQRFAWTESATEVTMGKVPEVPEMEPSSAAGGKWGRVGLGAAGCGVPGHRAAGNTAFQGRAR